jgi:hypothetical protein
MVRLTAFQVLATSRNRIVLVKATVAAALIASSSICSMLSSYVLFGAYLHGGIDSVTCVTLRWREAGVFRDFQVWFSRFIVFV